MVSNMGKYRDLAPLILRLVIGIVFLLHGLQKFGVIGDGAIQGVVGMFGNMSIPVPGLTAPLVALLEALGGLALILGVGTRIAAALLSVVMLVAILAVKMPIAPNPLDLVGGAMPGYELDLALLAGLVALLLLGPGRYAVQSEPLTAPVTRREVVA